MKIDECWEGDLLRRMRRLRYGHPDPDVQSAAEEVEDAAWPYITAAEHPFDEPATLFRFRKDERKATVDAMNRAMVEFKRAVHAAPNRTLPKGESYNGEDRPSYLARALAKEEQQRQRRQSGHAT